LNYKDIEKYKNLAFDARKNGEIEEATELMEMYLSKIDPSFTHPFHLFIAENYFEKKEYEKSLNSLNRSLEIMDLFESALLLRSKIYEILGENELAAKDKEKVQNHIEFEKSKWNDPNHYYKYK